jgi:hypothetical protein
VNAEVGGFVASGGNDGAWDTRSGRLVRGGRVTTIVGTTVAADGVLLVGLLLRG